MVQSMTYQSLSHRHATLRPASSAGLAAALLFAGSLVAAQPAWSASLQGSWSGGGFVKPQSGQRERVRCRVSYGRVNRRVYSVSATCATTSTTIRQTGEIIMTSPNRFVGDFVNHQYNVRGRVRVIVRGNRQSVTFSSANGSGALTLSRR